MTKRNAPINKIFILVILGVLVLILNVLKNPIDTNPSQNGIDDISEPILEKTPLLSRSTFWASDGIPICTETDVQKDPQIISDGAGGAIIIWYDHRGADSNIWAQRINASGDEQWASGGVIVCNASNHQLYPQITSDGVGGAIITWSDRRSGNSHVYAQRIDSTGTRLWSPSNGVAICSASGTQSIKITSDGSGGAVITWSDNRNGNWDIFAQRINSSGDVYWTADGVAACTYSADQVIPQLVSDGAGGAIITWKDYRVLPWKIYAQRVNSLGVPQWTANGTGVCTATAERQLEVQIVSDGSGGAIIIWEDYRNLWSDLYAQRLNAAGTKLWAANGVGVCTAGGNQLYPQIISDGAGGAFFTWSDGRNLSHMDIYVQKINSAGTQQWTSQGVAVCTSSGEQWYPQLTSDGLGGVIVTWESYNGADYDVFAELVDSAGVVEATNGVPVSLASDDQRDPQVASDGSGGGIITWHDERTGGVKDIYAQRITPYDYPVINNPDDIMTSTTGGETIDWIITDDRGSGQYRVLANDTGGGYYTWMDWAPWTNNTNLNVPINRTSLGIYNYTIEYYDNDTTYGIPNTVIVSVNDPPDVNQPDDISSKTTGSENISWILTDDIVPGQYRVLANDTSGIYYVWVDWTSWTNNTNLNVPVNHTAPGIFNYTIEYYDGLGSYGVPDTVIVLLSDTTPPNITLITPYSYQVFGNQSFDFELNIVEYNLDTIWYSIEGGSNYTVPGPIGTINQTEWGLYGNGTVEITFYANDTFGSIGSTQITVRKDTIIPNITIYSPNPYQFFGNPIFQYNISINETNLESIWYVFNNSINYPLVGTSGTLDQSVWDLWGNGTVILKFYANDTGGNMGLEEVIILKDTHLPDVIINNPLPSQVFSSASPDFDVQL